MEALPAVLRRDAGSCRVRLLRGTKNGLHRLGGGFLSLGDLPWLGLGRLRLGRFRSDDRLGLGWRHWFASVLLQRWDLGPRGQEGHLDLFGVFLAHLRAVKFSSLASVAQFPQFPHHLGEVVTRVEVVGTAQAGFALEVTVVGASWCLALARSLAGDTQASIVSNYCHHHGTGILGLGDEFDRFIPDVARLLLLVVIAAGLSA